MLKVLSVDNMRNSENKIMALGITEFELMKTAVQAIFPHVKLGVKTLVVAGGGNNGGDGLGIALTLLKNAENVEVLLVNNNLKPSGKIFFDEFVKLGGKVYNYEIGFDLTKYEQIIDCIFGIGFHGCVEGKYKDIIESINSSNIYVLSVDIPSGINGDTGLCDIAVKSAKTVAVGALKYGNILNKAKDYYKEICVCNIGNIDDYGVYLFEKSDAKAFLTPRKNFSHKGNYGYVAVIGGCENYVGAPRLASLGLCALKTGAGVSKIITPDCIKDAILPNLTLSTYFPLPSINGGIKFNKEAIDNALLKVSAMSFGMGVGINDEVAKTLEYILKTYTGKLVIDADGLNVLSKLNKSLLKMAKCKIVITPHIMEMSRLTNISTVEIIENPIKVAKDFSKEYGVITLLKGTASVITDGEETILVASGSPGMATAGSGDVLSGVLAGVLGWNDLQVNSVAFSAFLCGLAGELASEEMSDIAMTSLDTVSNIPRAIKMLKSDFLC